MIAFLSGRWLRAEARSKITLFLWKKKFFFVEIKVGRWFGTLTTKPKVFWIGLEIISFYLHMEFMVKASSISLSPGFPAILYSLIQLYFSSWHLCINAICIIFFLLCSWSSSLQMNKTLCEGKSLVRLLNAVAQYFKTVSQMWPAFRKYVWKLWIESSRLYSKWAILYMTFCFFCLFSCEQQPILESCALIFTAW